MLRKQFICQSFLNVSGIYMYLNCLNSIVLNFVTNEKYLEVYISNDVYDDLDILHQICSLYAWGNSLPRWLMQLILKCTILYIKNTIFLIFGRVFIGQTYYQQCSLIWARLTVCEYFIPIAAILEGKSSAHSYQNTPLIKQK